MITANEAREMSEKYREENYTNEIKEIEKSITCSVYNGNTSIRINKNMSEKARTKLLELGYVIFDRMDIGHIISWK